MKSLKRLCLLPGVRLVHVSELGVSLAGAPGHGPLGSLPDLQVNSSLATSCGTGPHKLGSEATSLPLSWFNLVVVGFHHCLASF